MDQKQKDAVERFREALLHFAEVGVDPNFVVAILLRHAAEIGHMYGLSEDGWAEITIKTWIVAVDSNVIEGAMLKPSIEA